jgi:hypothetical protein
VSVTASRIRLTGLPGMDLIEAAESAAWRAVCSIRAPQGLTWAQEHRFWSAVIASVERRAVSARKDLGPAPPPDLVVVRDGDD